MKKLDIGASYLSGVATCNLTIKGKPNVWASEGGATVPFLSGSDAGGGRIIGINNLQIAVVCFGVILWGEVITFGIGFLNGIDIGVALYVGFV